MLITLYGLKTALTAVLNTIGNKMDKNSPSGTGSLSINRLEGSEIGAYSVSVGKSNEASGLYSYAEGMHTISGADASHSEGGETRALAPYSHTEGFYTLTSATSSHAEGFKTIAAGESQHVQGEYNIEHSDGVYAHIVGNGYSETIADDDGLHTTDYRSNAHTLDWSGNAWYAGDIRVGGTSYDDADKLLSQNELLETVEVVKYVDTLTWDGDTTERPMASLLSNPPFGAYLISNVNLDISYMIQNSTFEMTYMHENGYTVQVLNLSATPIMKENTMVAIQIRNTNDSSSMMVVITLIDNYDAGNGTIFPYKGIYFTKLTIGDTSRYIDSFTITNYPCFPENSIGDKLKEEYLPSSVLTTANFVLDGTTLTIRTP